MVDYFLRFNDQPALEELERRGKDIKKLLGQDYCVIGLNDDLTIDGPRISEDILNEVANLPYVNSFQETCFD